MPPGKRIAEPWFKRRRDDAQLKGFVQGATAAATVAIIGSVTILEQRSIFDLATAAIGVVILVALLHKRLVVIAAGVSGPALWPPVQGGV